MDFRGLHPWFFVDGSVSIKSYRVGLLHDCMAMETVGLRLPRELLARIDEECRELGVDSRSERIRGILELFYSGDIVPFRRMVAVERERDVLRTENEMLKERIADLKHTEGFLLKELEDVKRYYLPGPQTRDHWWQFWLPKTPGER